MDAALARRAEGNIVMTTERQDMWADKSAQESARGNRLLAGFFGLLALPNENEREHACLDHSIGFSRDGRRGFKCGICKSILKWVDPPNETNL